MVYTIIGLWADTTEVTHAAYYAVMGTNPSYYNRTNCNQCPVENLTATEAMLYANALTKAEMSSADTVYSYDAITWETPSGTSAATKTKEASALVNVVIHTDRKGYRLPTEAEWILLQKGTSTLSGVYWKADYVGITNGAENNTGLYAWYSVNAAGIPQAVAQKKPNGFGLYDIIGNVEEYTSSTTAQGAYISKGVAADATLGSLLMIMAAQAQWLTGARLVRNP